MTPFKPKFTGVAYGTHPRGVVCHANINIICLVKPNQNVLVIRPLRGTAPQQRGGYDDFCAIAHENIGLSHRIKLRHERCDVSDILYPGDKGALVQSDGQSKERTTNDDRLEPGAPESLTPVRGSTPRTGIEGG